MKFFSDICMKCLNPQVRINKMVNEHTVDYYPSLSELTSWIHPLIFLWTSRGLYSLQNIFEFFLKPVYCTIVAEKFKIHGVKITGKCICESKKMNLFIFTCVPKLPLQAGDSFPFPPHNVFCIFSQQKGRIMEL